MSILPWKLTVNVIQPMSRPLSERTVCTSFSKHQHAGICTQAVGRRDGSPLQKDQGRTAARDPKQSATQCDEGLPKHFHAAARRKRVGTSAAVPRWPLRHLEKTKPQLAAANFWRGGCEIKRGRAMQVPGRYPDIGRPSLTSTPVANMGRTILGAALMLRPGWRAGGPQFWREQPEGSEVCCVF
jgi:hypothetical protein